jgi:hypothetical protein
MAIVQAFQKQIAIGSVAKISDYIVIKQSPKVIKQTPDPGTPVIQGMTIEIQAVSFSDVPYGVIDPQAPVMVKNISMADVEAVVEGDPRLKNSVQNGTIAPNDTDAVLQALNTGLAAKGMTGQLNSGDATELVKAINAAGFVNF